MMTLFQSAPLYMSGFVSQLGKARRDLNALANEKLLGSSVDVLAKVGYQFNYGVAADETMLSLATGPMASLLKTAPNPRAFAFHHCYAENGVMPWTASETDPASRVRYFPAALLRQLAMDHVAYFGAFAGGCSGLFPLTLMANGLLGATDENPVICLTADVRPAGTMFDAMREKSLMSDSVGGFVAGRKPAGYQALGVNYYSTTRSLVLLIEAVKRTVQMIRELADALKVQVSGPDVLVHYPNVFPEAWDMVTKYLQISREQHVLDGFGERAHCLSADSIITLDKLHTGREGRLHVVVNMGSGVHIGVGIFREVATK